MRSVWKFPLDHMKVPVLPEGSDVIHFGLDPSRNLCVWVDVPDPDADRLPHGYSVHGTGHEIPAESRHVASVVEGGYVWHLFRADGD